MTAQAARCTTDKQTCKSTSRELVSLWKCSCMFFQMCVAPWTIIISYDLYASRCALAPWPALTQLQTIWIFGRKNKHIHTHIRAYVHTYTHACMHTYLPTNVRRSIGDQWDRRHVRRRPNKYRTRYLYIQRANTILLEI